MMPVPQTAGACPPSANIHFGEGGTAHPTLALVRLQVNCFQDRSVNLKLAWKSWLCDSSTKTQTVMVLFSKMDPSEETRAKWKPWANFNFHATIKLWVRVDTAASGWFCQSLKVAPFPTAVLLIEQDTDTEDKNNGATHNYLHGKW